MGAPAANPRLEIRRERLLEAAQCVFAREGLRGASMERIAAEAGVARATVYAYFADKEDAFRQVCQRLAEQLVETVRTELAAEAPVADRVRAALLAKHMMTFQVARQSPFAADLMAAKDRLAGPVFAEAERRVVALLEEALRTHGVTDAGTVAQVLLAASAGVAQACDDAAAMTALVSLLVDGFLKGLLF